MAEYSCRIGHITRSNIGGKPTSAVGRASYILRVPMVDRCTGEYFSGQVTGDKQYVLASGTVLSFDGAPKEWSNPETLWNASCAFNNTKNGKSGYDVLIWLPAEMNDDELIDTAEAIVVNCQMQGFCVTWSIHKNKRPNEHGNYNPHLHLVLSVNPCDEHGFKQKCVTGYVVRNTFGHETILTADDFKKQDEYSKMYKYTSKDGVKKWMTKEEAAKDTRAEWKQVNRYPRKTKMSEVDWNERGFVDRFRKEVEDAINDSLRFHGYDSRVSRLSYKARGINKVPMVHMNKYEWQREEAERKRCEEEGIEYKPLTKYGKYNKEAKEENKRRGFKVDNVYNPADINKKRMNDAQRALQDAQRVQQQRSARKREEDERKRKKQLKEQRSREKKQQTNVRRVEKELRAMSEAIEEGIERSDNIGREII